MRILKTKNPALAVQGWADHERRRITAETALRLARYFHTNPEFWLNLQNFYDLELSKRSGKASEIERQIQPAADLATDSSS